MVVLSRSLFSFHMQAHFAGLALLTILRTALKYSTRSARTLHEICVQRFPEINFKPFQDSSPAVDSYAITGYIEHGMRDQF